MPSLKNSLFQWQTDEKQAFWCPGREHEGGGGQLYFISYAFPSYEGRAWLPRHWTVAHANPQPRTGYAS